VPHKPGQESRPSGRGGSQTAADYAEHSTFRWLLEPMLAAAGFEILTADFSGSVYGTYTCRKRSAAADLATG
jgi:hypothetical protein